MKRWILVLLLFLLTGSVIIWTATQSEYREEQRNVCELKTGEKVVEGDQSNISEVMTFDEVISQYAETVGISIEKASQYFSPDGCDLKNATYRILGIAINVTDSYQPTLEFYCKTAEHDQSWEITSIDAYILNRCYNGVIKQFDGEMEAWLRSECEIEYVINGDFYNNGTTTCTNNTGLSIGLGDVATITFGTTVTTTSNHYAYCYQDDTVKFQK